MAKRRPKKPYIVPDWIVTFGDMMSLLLCFFVLLAAFSELKRKHEYQRVMTAVKEAFGYVGGIGVVPTDDPPLRSMLQLLESLSLRSLKQTKVSQSPDRGIQGRETQVSKLPEGLMFTIGGGLTFEPESIVLREGAQRELLRLADMIRGRRNRIVIRGHASRGELVDPGTGMDALDLSYYRARAVMEFLVTQAGIKRELLALEARGDSEPMIARAYAPQQQAVNRRVDVILTEIVLEDLSADGSLMHEPDAGGPAWFY
jgi:chemotaxis protein MotB